MGILTDRIIYYTMKNKSIYRVTFPGEPKLFRGGGMGYRFDIYDITGDDYHTKEIRVFNALDRNNPQSIDAVILSTRSLYSILGNTAKCVEVTFEDRRRLFAWDKKDNDQIRETLLNYMRDRFELFWREPFTVIEILGCHDNDVFAIMDNIIYLDHVHELKLPRLYSTDNFVRHPENHLKIQIAFNRTRKGMLETLPKGIASKRSKGHTIHSYGHYHYKTIDLAPELRKGFAFVMMPFKRAEFPQTILRDVFEPMVGEVLHIPCIRSDSKSITHFLENLIYTYIVKSDVIIADLSTQNPNVIFEFGLALALEKDVIAVFDNKYKTKGKPAFDYEHYGTLFYDDYDDLKAQLREKLPAFKKQ